MPVELKRADSGRRFSADCDWFVTDGGFEGDPRAGWWVSPLVRATFCVGLARFELATP